MLSAPRYKPGPAAAPPAAPEAFALLLVEDFTHLALSCALEPLRIVEVVAGRELYRWSLLAKGARPPGAPTAA